MQLRINLNLPIVLFLILAILKSAGVIAWSWWWVTAPLWGPVAIFGIGFIIFMVLAALGVLD